MLTEPFESAASEEGKVLQVFHAGISIPSTVNYISHVIGCFFSFVAIFVVVVFCHSQHVIHKLVPGSHIACRCAVRSDSMLHWLTFIKKL